MEKRVLGRTGAELSVVGFGGIIVMDVEPEEAARNVSEAIERGVNYFDVAPSYGNAEERLGPALEPYRQGVFLACKTGERTKGAARAELEGSLQRLRTDYFDLYQLHAVTTAEDVETIFGPGGAMEALLEAKREGKVRFLGFSAHSEEAAIACMNRYPFDSILFPFNWVTWHEGGFGPRVLDAAQAKGAGRLALKALAKRKWREGEARQWSKTWYRPAESFEDADLGLRFTLSLPVTAAVTPGHIELFRWACDSADRYTPLTPEEVQRLAELSRGLEPIFEHAS